MDSMTQLNFSTSPAESSCVIEVPSAHFRRLVFTPCSFPTPSSPPRIMAGRRAGGTTAPSAGANETTTNWKQRDPTLEKLFIVPNHPLRAHVPGGTTYVYLQDTSQAGLAATWALEKDREIPSGTLQELLASGQLQLFERDAVFSRSIQGSGRPEDDHAQVWVTGGRVITREMNQAFDDARDEFLGPRSLRTRTRAQKPRNDKGNVVQGPATGGIAYERTKICKSVQPPARCYTFGPSAETPRSIVAPVASAKMETETVEADAAGRRRLLMAAGAIADAAMREAPLHVQEHLKQIASLVNVPMIGVANNYAYATGQVNVATAKRPRNNKKKPGKKAKGPTLAADMGFFGDAHEDRKDELAHYSHMSANSDLPDDDNYTPGFFFILQLGVFILLDRHTSINFSGLRRHGGTPPLCVIFYPPSRMMDGTARWTLGAMPNNTSFIFPPEMLHAGVTNRIQAGWPAEATCDRASFVREGPLMMTQDAHAHFVSRSLSLMVNYFLLQLPKAYEVRFDPDKFSESITMVVDDRRVHLEPWEFAPGHRLPAERRPQRVEAVDCPDVEMVDQDTVRSAAWARWDAYVANAATHIPYVGRRGPLKPRAPPPPPEPEMKKKAGDRGEGYEGADEGEPGKSTRRKPRQPRRKAPLVEVETEEGESGSDAEPLPTPSPPSAKRKRPSKLPKPPPPPPEGSSPESEDTDDERPFSAVAARDARAKARARRGQQLESVDNNDGDNDSDDEDTEEGYEGAAARTVGRANAQVFDCVEIVRPPRKRGRVMHVDRSQAVHTVGDWNAGPLNDDIEEGVVMSADAGLSNPTPPAPNRFCATLTLEALLRNSDDISTAWLISRQTKPPTSDLGELDAAYSALSQNPSAAATVPFFETIWASLDQMNTLEALNTLRTRLDRERIMLTTYMAWRWLDAYCPMQIEAALLHQHETGEEGWIGRLARDVRGLLESRVEQHILSSQHYGLAIPNTEFEFRNRRGRILVSDAELSAATVAHTTRIIALWLHFPVVGVSRYQGWFVHALLRTVGRGVLLLDETWRAFSQIRKYVLGDSQARDHCNQQFQALVIQLSQHPLRSTTSPESAALRQTVDILNLVRLPSSSSLTMAIELVSESSAPPRPSSSCETAMDIDVEPDPSSTRSPTSDCSSGLVAPTTPSPSLLLTSQLPKLAHFTRFLDEALTAVHQGPQLANPTPYQTLLLSDIDRFSPFRELAPSRCRATSAHGPYTADFAATDSGFLSAMIFRAITFNTDFCRLARMRYRDGADFTVAMEEEAAKHRQAHGVDPPPAFFCDPCAYGPINDGRTVDLAQQYAAAISGGDGLAAQLQLSRDRGEAQLPFVTFWKWLKGRTKSGPRFPELGQLGSYLLAADYTYTSPQLVASPTIDDLGAIICGMNKGAVSGLEHLGLIPRRSRNLRNRPRHSTLSACTAALKIVLNALNAHWSEQVRRDVGLDLVMIEHSLCKLSRAIGKKKFGVVDE
ncbi:hypothetical protein R3P38DRAFT_2939430 [Favolaschia claudopus]|uniref:JmjC domain-containing protein n=1 Tax=Favolaschia claudopus TaxID=2862362 RepID=A0AAW0BM63_9AGAR